MNKYYHRGKGECVCPEMVGQNSSWYDLPHHVRCNKIEEFDDHVDSLPVYAHCSPDLPVGWFEGEEVYQVKREVWKATTKSYYDTEFEDSRRIWIDPVADIAPYGYEKYFDTEFHEMRFRPIRKASIGLNDIFSKYNPFAKYEHFTKEQLLEEVKRLKEFEIAFKQIGDNS